MSNPLYTEFAAIALQEISANGVAITVERDIPGGSFSPSTGMNSTAPSVASTPSKAISKAIKASDQWKLPSGKFSHVRLLLLAASGMTFAPEPGDRIPSFEGAPWTIPPRGNGTDQFAVRPIAPDGETVIAYEVWVTR